MRLARAAVAGILAFLLALTPGATMAQDDFDFEALLDDIAEVPASAETTETGAAPAAEPSADVNVEKLVGEVEQVTNQADAVIAEEPSIDAAVPEEPEMLEAEPEIAAVPEPESLPPEEPVITEAPAEAQVEDLDALLATEEPTVPSEPEIVEPPPAEEVVEPVIPPEPAIVEEPASIEELAPVEEPEIAEMPEVVEEPLAAEEAAAAPEADAFDALLGEVEPAPAEVVEQEFEEMEEVPAPEMIEAEEVETAVEPAEVVEELPEALEEPAAEVEPAVDAEAARMLAKQEEVRLQAKEKESLQAMEAGYKALSEKKYEEALRQFETALSLPVRPKTEESRQRAKWGYAEASYLRARELYESRERAQIEQAAGYLDKGLAQMPDHQPSLRLKTRIDGVLAKPPPPVKVDELPEVKQKESSIDSMIDQGRQYFEIGDYNRAESIFQEVLIKDEYNVPAMRFLKRIGEKRLELRTREREATAADMVQQVRDAWNPPILLAEKGPSELLPGVAKPGETPQEKLQKKMEEIIIPSLEFRTANINDVVNFLVEASIAGDEEGLGVNIILNLAIPGQDAAASATPAPTPAPAAGGFGDEGFGDFFSEPLPGETGGFGGGGGGAAANVPTITLNLRRVSLLNAIRYITEVAGLKYRVEESAVIITPAGVVSGQVITRMYPVQPSILDVIIEKEAVQPQAGADFETGFGEFGARTTMKRGDVKDFFEKAGVPFPVGTSITYNPSISKLIVANTPENHDKLSRVLAEINLTPFQVEIEARFVEIAQSDLEELGFEWLLTDDYEIAAKQNALGGIAGQERIQIDANSEEGGFTRGLRFFNFDSSAGTINPIGSPLTTATTTPLGNVLSFSSVLTNPEVTMIIHALDQSGNADLLSAPRVTTRTGQSATIQVVQEIIYPTEFEQDITVISGGDQPDRQVVTVTPGAFETRPVGVILTVTPTVAPDGYTIDLALSPEVAELTDWINYGSIFEGQEIFIPQPIFSSRNVNTTISIWDGQTVVMGGLIREDFVSVNDKIPLLGDIPFLGRLFRNEGEQSTKRNLIIFVTARLVRPDGRPLNEANTLASEPTAPVAETITP